MRIKTYGLGAVLFLSLYICIDAVLTFGGKEKAKVVKEVEVTTYLREGEPTFTYDITKDYTAEELDEIYKDEPALGRLAKDLYGVGEGRIVSRENWHKLIPTWPDFIELEKTLHLYWEDPNPDPNNPWNTDAEWIIGKGTKIYFKDD